MKITSHSNSDLIVSQKVTKFSDATANVQDTTEESSCPVSKKSRTMRKRSKDFRLPSRRPLSSQLSIKRSNRLDKNTKNYSTKTSALDKSVTTIMKRRVLNSLKPQNVQS